MSPHICDILLCRRSCDGARGREGRSLGLRGLEYQPKIRLGLAVLREAKVTLAASERFKALAFYLRSPCMGCLLYFDSFIPCSNPWVEGRDSCSSSRLQSHDGAGTGFSLWFPYLMQPSWTLRGTNARHMDSLYSPLPPSPLGACSLGCAAQFSLALPAVK